MRPIETPIAPATTYLLRRQPPRGTSDDGTVVFTLEDIATAVGEDPRATARVTVDGETVDIRSLQVAPSGTDTDTGNELRLVREVLDALRGDGCRAVTATALEPGWVPYLLQLGFTRAQTNGQPGLRIDL